MRNSYFKVFGLIAITSLAASAPSAMAIEKPTLNWYGQLNLSADYLDTNQKQQTGQAQISSNASRLGARGDFIIDEKIKLIWQLESAVNPVEGDWKLNRNSFIGFTGSWGTAKAGLFDTPMKQLNNKVEFFTNQVGYSRNVIGIHGGIDRRFKNGVMYESPELAGVILKAHYSANTKDSSTQSSATRAFSSSAEYQLSGFWVAVAYDQTGKEGGHKKTITLADGSDLSLESQSQKVARIASSYDFGRVKISGLYQQIRDDLRKTSGFGAGASLKLTNQWILKTQAYRYRANHGKTTADIFAIGADYHYNKYLRFYVTSSIVKNKNNLEAATPFHVGRSASPKVNLVKDPKATNSKPFGVSVGTIFQF